MAVVIRLQGLNATAGTEDIRKFFTGLKIPSGGVHIIGGEREEAFIIFASDEDARRAMRRSLGCIMGSPVTLLLSSKTEMQDMLEKSTSTAQEQKRRPEENARRDGKSMDLEVGRRPVIAQDHSPNPHRQGPSSSNEELYLFLRGLPYTATEQDILNFFSGLAVDDIILLNNAPGTGVVKFATSQDAYEGLKRDREYIGSRYVEVSRHRGPYLGGGSGNLQMNRNRDNISVRDRSPIRHQRNPQHHARSKSPAVGPEEEYCVLVENLAYTVEKIDIKILFSKANLKDDQILHLLSSDGRRTRCAFVLFRSQRDYCDALSNEKRLFQNRWVITRPISREKMIALLESKDKSDRPYGDSERVQERPPSFPRDGNGSERAMGISDRAYPRDGYGSERAMGISDRPYSGDGYGSERAMGIGDRPYPRDGYGSERAMGISDRPYAGDGYDSERAMGFSDRPYRNTERIQERPLSHPDGGYDSEKCCLLVQNLPSDVRKDEIMNFFFGFNVMEDMVHIIGGHNGDGVGKALILFRSEAEATSVLSLDGQRFLGSEVILKCITRSQMQQLRSNHSMSQTQMLQHSVPRGEQYFGSSVASYRPDDKKYPDYRIPSDDPPQMGHSSGQIHGFPSHEPYGGGLLNSQDKGNGFRGNYDAPVQSHGGPVCVQLLNLPFRIEKAEIYDFCYGYHIIPGSVQLQFDPSGRPDGTATAAFESHQEALKAIRELSGRPIGPRKIELVLM